MNATRIVILVLALAAAGGAAFLIQRLMLSNNDQVVAAAPEVIMVDVLVAARDLAPGDSINSGSLRWQQWPEDALTPNLISREATPNIRETLEGGTVRRNVTTGEAIVAAAIVDAGNTGLMAALLSPGMRAMSVAVSDETAAGGFILPGDHVDVVLTREVSTDRRNSSYQSATILSNVRVLAVDQIITDDIDGGAKVSDTATLEISPGQAELLAIAIEAGSITLTLRSFADIGAVQDDLANYEMPEIFAPPASTQTEPHRVTVLRNGQSNRVRVEGGM